MRSLGDATQGDVRRRMQSLGMQPKGMPGEGCSSLATRVQPLRDDATGLLLDRGSRQQTPAWDQHFYGNKETK